MAQKMISFLIAQAIICQVVYSSVIGRLGCGCGGGCGCSNILPVAEQVIAGPYFSGPSYLPQGSYLSPSQVVYDQPTTIIQDSTVANNLANALQLLVVSNLLSNTLPLEQNVVVPAANLAPVAVSNLAPYELPLGAPFALSSSFAPVSCGCGGCGCGGCGLGPYSVVY